MTKKLSLLGQTFGRLTVISEAPSRKGQHSRWVCLCSCGKQTIVDGTHLNTGRSKSCGCLRHDVSKDCNTVHGFSGSKLYSTWLDVKKRCHDTKRKDFKHYGGRGIAMSQEWVHNFEAFRDLAMQNGYAENLSIDRIDVDGDYCPTNCRWVSQVDQVRNRRNTRKYKGKTIKEWAEILGLNYHTLHSRITKCGWTFEKAISTPKRDW